MDRITIPQFTRFDKFQEWLQNIADTLAKDVPLPKVLDLETLIPYIRHPSLKEEWRATTWWIIIFEFTGYNRLYLCTRTYFKNGRERFTSDPDYKKWFHPSKFGGNINILKEEYRTSQFLLTVPPNTPSAIPLI